ncbi:MAG: SpoIIE family protein phosphatase [Spirochaetaceae bacterium]|nr:SpoIIE family protein phosphatase [Spirochaetaceae bacterium]
MNDAVARLPVPDDDGGRIHLDLVMAAAEMGSFDWDIREDVLVWDERICRIFGIDPETFDARIATFWAALVAEDVPAVESAVEIAIATCGEYEAEYRVRHPDGTVRWVDARGRVLAGADGQAHHLLGVARDSTELRLARDTVARALEHMADAFLAVDDSWRVTFLNHHAETLVNAGQEAVGQPLWEVWPALTAGGHEAALRDAMLHGAAGVLPLYVAPTDRWFQLRLVPASQEGGGLSIFGADVTAARAAEVEAARELNRPEQARRVLAYMAALAEADSLPEVIDTVATMVLPAFGATGMLVSLMETGRLRLAGHSGYGPAAVDLLGVLGIDDDSPIALVLRTREPLFLSSPEAYLGRFPSKRDLVEATGKQAWAFLPLTVSGRALGTLTISFDEPRELAPEERSLLVSVGGLIAQTVARARLRDLERTLAAELQSQLLPRALPQPAGLSARVRYLPATDGMGVGGDWYDVLELPGQRVGLVIGDVQGHNMRAAAVMGQLRNALRAYAAEGHEPAAVLSRTNRLMSDLDPTLFATCCYLVVDLRTGSATLALAGHPPPLVRTADGQVSALMAPVGPPLGVAPEDEYLTREVVLAPGDVVVLYTDGLVEDSRRSFDEGTEALMEVLRVTPPDDLDVLADRLMAVALATGHRSDDIAALVVRHDGPLEADPPVNARTVVDRADPRAARASRDFIARFVGSPELVDVRETCALLVSEVVTNALRHTDGQVVLELWRFSRRLRVEVSDEESRGPVAGGRHLLDDSGRGVPLMDALSDRWGTAPKGEGKVVWFELDLPA